MPTQTFWNLPEQKREALIAVAVEEFANHDYNDASISRIVQQAGIAKGSIYQYFADKRDLFLFLVDLSNQKRLQYVEQEPLPQPDMPFWALLRWQMSASTRAALAYPLLTKLFYRSMSDALPFHDDVVVHMKAVGNERWRQFVRSGIEQGAIGADVDIDLAVMMLGAVFNELGTHLMQRLRIDDAALHELDVTRFQTPEVERIFDDVIRMLERGIGGSQERS